MDSDAVSALSRCQSDAVVMVDGKVVSGLQVRWFVVDRPVPFDPSPLLALDDDLLADLRQGDECAGEAVENLKAWLLEAFTPDEIAALREYLSVEHGIALFTAPVSLPFKPRADGEPLALGRELVAHPRKAGDLEGGAIWLHRHYGYSLPFKVVGRVSYGAMLVDDPELRGMALEMVPPGSQGVGL